jgi:hypothetical protein
MTSSCRLFWRSAVLKIGQWNSACLASMVWSWRHFDVNGAAMVPAVLRHAYECVGWCETPHGSSNSQPYCHLRLGVSGPHPLKFRPGAQRFPLLPYFEEGTWRAPIHQRRCWSSCADIHLYSGHRLLPTGVLQAREAVGQMHECWWGLMPRSAHIGVYLVHAVSCRRWTRETYFPTISRTFS